MLGRANGRVTMRRDAGELHQFRCQVDIGSHVVVSDVLRESDVESVGLVSFRRAQQIGSALDSCTTSLWTNHRNVQYKGAVCLSNEMCLCTQTCVWNSLATHALGSTACASATPSCAEAVAPMLEKLRGKVCIRVLELLEHDHETRNHTMYVFRVLPFVFIRAPCACPVCCLCVSCVCLVRVLCVPCVIPLRTLRVSFLSPVCFICVSCGSRWLELISNTP